MSEIVLLSYQEALDSLQSEESKRELVAAEKYINDILI